MAAMRMPKGTPEEQAARDAALEAGYQQAARVPLGSAKTDQCSFRVCASAAAHPY